MESLNILDRYKQHIVNKGGYEKVAVVRDKYKELKRISDETHIICL